MDIHIVGPEDDDPFDTYEVWLDVDRDHLDGICIGAGRTKIDAITDAQRELVRLSRHMNEMVWRENGGRETAPCLSDQNPTER